MVGSDERILVSSVILSSEFRGTLKSTLIKTLLFLISISFIVSLLGIGSPDIYYFLLIYKIRSLILIEYPHSLSYHAIIFTIRLSITVVMLPSTIDE